MNFDRRPPKTLSVGIIGFGAFGMLIAEHISDQFGVFAYDTAPDFAVRAQDLGVTPGSLETVAKCDVVVLATPVSSYAQVAASIAPLCRPGALVMDVGSAWRGAPAPARHRH